MRKLLFGLCGSEYKHLTRQNNEFSRKSVTYYYDDVTVPAAGNTLKIICAAVTCKTLSKKKKKWET